MRWFLGPAETARASAFDTWFLSGRTPAGGRADRARQDLYVRDEETEALGVKAREGKSGLEVKALVDPAFCELRLGGRVARVEVWTKVTSKALLVPPGPEATRAVRKRRRLRKFDTTGPVAIEIALGAGASGEDPLSGEKPARGCNVEWTALEMAGSPAGFTFALEAFAVDAGLEPLREALEKTLAALGTTRPGMPALDDAWIELSYPRWVGTRSRSAPASGS